MTYAAKANNEIFHVIGESKDSKLLQSLESGAIYEWSLMSLIKLFEEN